MLDRIKKEPVYVGFVDFEWQSLSNVERRLIDLYRALSDKERAQIRRLSEVLAINPTEIGKSS